MFACPDAESAYNGRTVRDHRDKEAILQMSAEKDLSDSLLSQDDGAASIRAVRSRLIDRGLVVFSIVLPAAVLLSLSRVFEHSWNPAYYAHMTLAVLILTTTVFRKKLPYAVRTSVLLGTLLILGVVGLAAFGLPGGGIPLLLTFATLTTVAFGTRAGIVACLICLLVIVAAGAAICTGTITFPFDIGAYATSVTAWGIMTAGFAVFLSPVIIGLGVMHDRLVNSFQTLSQSETRFRRIMDNLFGSFIYQHDTEGNINYVSRSLTNVLGYEPDEFLKHFTTYLTDHQVNEEVCQHTAQSIQGVIQHPYEAQIRHKNGSIRWLEISETPLRDASGAVVSVEGIAHDISERKRLEEQLRQSQKMEAVGQLAGGVAHDFNNLLQAILGFGELAFSETKPGSTVHDGLEQVLAAGNRAAVLVRQLLAFSRQQVLKLEDLDLSEVVADLAKMIRRVIGEHIALDIKSEAGLLAIHADRGQIEQIMMNLCVNARDAMPDGGKLILQADFAELDAEYCKPYPWTTPGRYAMLSVTDTGCGMDQETQQHIFEPFFTTKGLGKGTGLGLSTVYGIVHQHKGIINIYSEKGIGTTVKIYLPLLQEPTAENSETIAAAPPSGGTETILMAEDDEAVRSVAKRFLNAAGYTVLTASNGKEAIRVFDENIDTIDFVLLDVVMPELGGRAVFDHIQTKRPETCVLFASGYTAGDDQTDSLLDLGVKLIQKPYHHNDLLTTVRQMLDNRGE